ncbi:hypothetical protein HBB16_16420 [Pseudonocardia sp. MCCB 268]|nr:hypothetical protein [Pseudonocardia cytotoxica]
MAEGLGHIARQARHGRGSGGVARCADRLSPTSRSVPHRPVLGTDRPRVAGHQVPLLTTRGRGDGPAGARAVEPRHRPASFTSSGATVKSHVTQILRKPG